MEGFDDFVFSNGPVREGMTRRGEPIEAEAFEEGVEREERAGEKKEIKLPTIDLVLDQSGTARTTISHLPRG